MKSVAILGLASVLGAVGCASTNVGAPAVERESSGVPWRDASMHVGEARIMDTRVNPLAPVGVASDGATIALSYSRGRQSRTVTRMDSESLRVVSSKPSGSSDDSTGSTQTSARVELEGGRFVLVWKRGSVEWGYRALAQEFRADGSPLGAPVVISPPDVDVMGSPQAVSTDGRNLVATFTGASEKSIELVAVPIEVQAPESGQRFARK